MLLGAPSIQAIHKPFQPCPKEASSTAVMRGPKGLRTSTMVCRFTPTKSSNSGGSARRHLNVIAGKPSHSGVPR